MDNYRKGNNAEEEISRDNIPIPDLKPDFLWMKVKAGSKMRLLISHALSEFRGQVVWTGSGPAVQKTISCAEIMKREMKYKLHQITKIGHITAKEYWEPKTDDLDKLVVTRKIPAIYILLSSEPLNKNEPGYQSPGSKLPFGLKSCNR